MKNQNTSGYDSKVWTNVYDLDTVIPKTAKVADQKTSDTLKISKRGTQNATDRSRGFMINKNNLFVASLITMLSAVTYGKGADLFKFENGNTLSFVTNKNPEHRVAVFDTNNQKISKNYGKGRFFFILHNKYVLSQEASDILLLKPYATLFIVDGKGNEISLQTQDRYYESAIAAPNDTALVTSQQGQLHHIDLTSGLVINTQKVSTSLIDLNKSSSGQIFLTELQGAIKKIYFLNEKYIVDFDKTMDIGSLTGVKPNSFDGPFKVTSFPNGNIFTFHKSGKILFYSPEAGSIVFSGEPHHFRSTSEGSPYEELHKLSDGRYFYVSDSFNIHTLDAYGNFHFYGPKEKQMIPESEIESTYEIKNSEVGCIPFYINQIKKSRDIRTQRNGVSALVSILNPVVGIASLFLNQTNMVAGWSWDEQVKIVIRTLDAAENDVVSPEIKTLAGALTRFNKEEFPDEKTVMKKLRDLNQSKRACQTGAKNDVLFFKELIYRLAE